MEDQDPKKIVASIIRSARLRTGWGVRDLGRRANVTPSTISKLERGEIALGPVTLRKLTDARLLSSDEWDLISEAVGEVSSRMKTSPRIVIEGADYDGLCIELIRLVTPYFTGLDEENFSRGFGEKSGLLHKGYDFLIQFHDKTWMGFSMKPGEVRVAKTDQDNPRTLPPLVKGQFEKEGGIVLRLVPQSEMDGLHRSR